MKPWWHKSLEFFNWHFKAFNWIRLWKFFKGGWKGVQKSSTQGCIFFWFFFLPIIQRFDSFPLTKNQNKVTKGKGIKGKGKERQGKNGNMINDRNYIISSIWLSLEIAFQNKFFLFSSLHLNILRLFLSPGEEIFRRISTPVLWKGPNSIICYLS